jgi:CheY-like chemotaxis protein
MTSKSILVVEDNPDDAELAVEAFRSGRSPHDVHVARDGPEALEMICGSDGAAAPPVLPALVLLDLKLPGMDGFDILRRIRADARTRYLPVVILTSSTQRLDLLNGYRLGANSYVRKPVSFQEFLATANQIASYWLSLNEPPPSRC